VPDDAKVKQERTAHHEPGHVVVAAAQGLRLRPEGVMVDPSGWGLGCYRKESDGSDELRKSILLATFAGYYAEKRFCEDHSFTIADPKSWFYSNPDGYEASILVSEMSVENLTNGSVPTTFLELQKEARQQVERRWTAIKEVAITLLSKNWEPRKLLASGARWSHEDDTVAKYVTGSEIIEILARHNICASL
jgi:hypothetical protein